ncbi:hypothetical protein N9L11_02015, partial [Euryarchaeota archaeon]|nr:hypothetical protein [Euryarchaeota archaeon]
MEELPQASRWTRFYQSEVFLIIAFFAGLLLSVMEPVFRSFSGYDVSDAIWPYAYRTLQWTMFLRGNLFIFLLGTSVLMFATFIVLQRHMKGHQNPRWANGIGLSLLGLLTGFIVLFFALDIFYLRGAFLLLPTAYGFLLIGLLLMVGGIPHIPRESSFGRISKHVVHIAGVFFAAWLVMPGIPALIGIAPSPPDAPLLGYGAEPGPFETTMSIHPYTMPEEVLEIQDSTEADIDFSI